MTVATPEGKLCASSYSVAANRKQTRLMKIFALHRFLFVAFVATALSLSAHAQTQVGRILVAKVEGHVLKVLADGSTAAVSAGGDLTEKDTITTGKDSSVVLVFMNGSSVKLGPESRLAIDEFKMDPLADDLDVSALKAEPTVSKTTLNLSYGEMVGDVKKLNTASNYSIKTPVGAAGIRGTIYRIVFRPDSTGKAFFTVSTAEGRVVMEGVTSQEIPVPEGKEVVVEIDVPATPDAAPPEPKIVTQDIPAATQTIIKSEAAVITEAVAEVVIPPTPPAPTPTPDPTPTPEPEKKTEPETPTTPTPVTTTTPETGTPTTPTQPTTTILPPTTSPVTLTPGAGK